MRIGVSKFGALLNYLRARKSLEPKLAKLGVQVEWKEFVAGPQLMETLMASLLFEHGERLDDPAAIGEALAPLKVILGHDSEPLPPQLLALLPVVVPSPEQSEAILQPLDQRLERLKIVEPHVSRDLLALHGGAPGTAKHLRRFSFFHTHDSDEGRYIVSAECLFGFVLPEGPQVRLTLHPRDVLRIPAGTEHWFQLTPLQQLKAVRLFSHLAEWVTRPVARSIAPSMAA